MAVRAERMRIDLRPNVFVRGSLQDSAQDIVPAAAQPHFFQVDILQAIAVLKGGYESGRRVRFAGTQDVSMLLLVGCQPQIVEAHVAVKQVARHDGLARILAVFVALPRRLNINGGLKPGAQARLLHGLPHPPDDIIGRGQARVDDFGGEGAGDDLAPRCHQTRIGDDFLGKTAFQPANAEVLGGSQARCVWCAQRIADQSELGL